ncbi:MAG TPA: xanthine dehydrogenase family protein molybdopterin-binding subunit [Chloroflexota bacterium]|nr:xanthine dehydrogenase family protein molybdopterin-binding subunit [Chloroflexota bacterium]
MAQFLAIGKPVGRVEGEAKVTGAARYAADVLLPGLLWAKCLRSPLPHARIVRIDTARAAALPGVHAVITAADLPNRLWGRWLKDMPVLARDRVRFVGEKVAAVAAEDPDIAEEALNRIEVEYEELPAVFDPLEAVKETAPLLHPELHTYQGLPQPVAQVPNCHSHQVWTKGDIAEGFRQAARIFEHVFTTPTVHHGYIEPQATVVRAWADGGLEAWLSNKMPFRSRQLLAQALELPEERIVIHPCHIGGDFGGKGSIGDALVAYYLSRRTGRPVKLVLTYTEELLAGNPRHAAVIRLRTGLTADHRLCARQAEIYFNSGAYGAFKPTAIVNLWGAAEAGGVYRIPHVRIDAYSVYTNQVPCGHMRSPGGPQVYFAVESHMDMIAQAIGMDPYEFRLRNALEEGDLSPVGHRWRNIRLKEVLRRAAEVAGWGQPKPGPTVGRGIACAQQPVGGGVSEAIVRVEPDGRVTLITAVPDVGTGAHTVLRQVVAEALTLPVEWVRVQVGGTDEAPADTGSGASRVTHVAGQAAYQASMRVGERLRAVAARALGVAEGEVRLEDGRFVAVSDGGRSVAWAEVAASGPVEERAAYRQEQVEVTCFTVQVAEVEVDPETGQVGVRRLVTAHDVGTIINPLGHQGQIDGGAVMGLGYALVEELGIEEGRVTTANLGEFKIPTVRDIPELVTVLVESEEGPVPYRGKAIGESANVPVAGAIANAVYDAVGVRITELPITAEKVRRALRERAAGEAGAR